MYRRYSPFLLMSLLLHLSAVQCISSPGSEKEARWAGKIKQSILKLGKGEDARVMIKLRDKTKLAGYVDQVSDDHFVITNAKTGEAAMVAYSNVAQVKGHNLSTGPRSS
jgi:hypothetical protein